MSWSIKPSGSWGIATTTSPATETAAALARPGSWLYDTNPSGGTQRLFVRKDQWGTLAATPGVDNVSPSSGPQAGGTGVTITGEGLIGSTGVTFGGTAATGFLVNSDSQITCLTPAKSAGPVNVVVQNPRGNVTVTNGYTYV
jgi:IPT/TIG domain-containing protein